MQKNFKIIGGQKLKGEIVLAGAKNLAIKVIVASLLAKTKSILENVPRISDVETTLNICQSLGAEYKWLAENIVEIDPTNFKKHKVDLEYSGTNRAPILFLGPLLHKFQKAEIPVLGGCQIGSRPVDFHVDGYTRLGATIECTHNSYTAEAKTLKGTIIKLEYPSVGATENILMGASLAQGTTVIQNAAIEPEIEELVLFLQSMGAIIYQDVNRTWIIEGVKELNGTNFKIMNDRIEAASFASLALATGSNIFIQGAEQEHLATFLNWVIKIGGHFRIEKNGIHFLNDHKLKAVTVETDTYPGFATDWQSPFCIVLTQAEGISIIHETVYEDRLGYTNALNQMGAKIQVFSQCLGRKPCRFAYRDFPHSAVIIGPTPLLGQRLEVPDLRAGFSYLVAALVAQGESELIGIERMERGYQNLKERLINLGAIIK